MEVVIVPKAHLSVAVGQPWHELIQAARSGESGMTTLTTYTFDHVDPRTLVRSKRTEPIPTGRDGSPNLGIDVTYRAHCPGGHAMLYDRRDVPYLHFQNW